MTTLSLVIPVYNEESSLNQLHLGINKVCGSLVKNNIIQHYEIVFVSDGSTDSSNAILKQLAQKYSNTQSIILRKNFGKSKALQCGFQHTSGDVILTMDADLQDDPNEIPNFIKKIHEGYDLVSGWKQNRLDPLEKTFPSKIFNFVTSKLSGIKIHDFNCGYKAYKREVVSCINLYGEFHRYIPVFASRYGFKVAEIAVKHHKREFGKSKYGLERYLRGLFDALSAIFLLKYYDKPMYFFGKIGMFFSTLGIIICSYLTAIWFNGESIGGRPLLILGVLFILVGLQSIFFGLLANLIIDRENQYSSHIIKEIVK